MRSRKVLLGLGCLAVSATFSIETAHADRRTGLAGNLLIQDPDDLFPFPQYTLQHRNMLRLDYGTGPAGSAVGSSGNGVFTLGDDNAAYAIALHRGDLLSPDVVGLDQELAWLGGVGNPFGVNFPAGNTGTANQIPTPGAPVTVAPAAAGANTLPATVIDLAMGRRLTGTSAYGVRLGLGRGAQIQKVDGDDTGSSQTFVVVQGGYSSTPEDGLRYDFSGNLGAAFANQNGGGDDVASGMRFRLGALGRGYYPLNDLVDLGFLANVNFSNERTSVEATDSDRNLFSGSIMGGVGPSINLDRAKVAGYGGLILGFGKLEPDSENDDDEVGLLSVALPMVNMATEVQLLDWLYVRTGAQYTWSLRRSKLDETKERTTAGVFGWTAGLGVTKNNFYLDGVIRNDFMTNGPAFVGGGTPGFLAMASFTYKFGDVFSGEGATAPIEPAPPAPAPAPEPAPAPAPVEPAPDQELEPPAADATGTTTSTGAATGTSASGSVGASGSIGLGR